jgi:hypothetical protein
MAVVGEYWGGEFVPGRAVACYLYMQESKNRDDIQDMHKFELARRVLKLLVEYLDQAGRSPGTLQPR